MYGFLTFFAFLCAVLGEETDNYACNNATVKHLFLSAIRNGFFSGMERRNGSPMKLALSVNGVPLASAEAVKMNWFIRAPEKFPNAVTFPAGSYPGVNVEKQLKIKPSRWRSTNGRNYLCTVKSPIEFADADILSDVNLDFFVQVDNPCFDVSFTIRNVERINIPELGGFSRLPKAPNIEELGLRIQEVELGTEMPFSFDMSVEAKGNIESLLDDSARFFWRKMAPFPKRPVWSGGGLVANEHGKKMYSVYNYHRLPVRNETDLGLYQSVLGLFEFGKGRDKFSIEMAVTTEIAKPSTPVEPSIEVFVNDGTSDKQIQPDGQDRMNVQSTRGYEVIIKANRYPQVNLTTPRSPESEILQTFNYGLRYYIAYPLVINASAADSGRYVITAISETEKVEFVFYLVVE